MLTNSTGFGSFHLLSASACVLDPVGRIVEVNEAWRSFSIANGCKDETFGVGSYYLDICALAVGDPFAILAAQRLEEVLSGTESTNSFVYPCHSLREKVWFRCRFSRHRSSGYSVSAHFDVTSTILACLTLRRKPDAAWAGHSLDLFR